eukprot:m.185147 g.185147  ORF g.185147 m.185147 type:complete len:84 (+) comp16679_c9_seq1:565-816(+)
MVLSCRFMNQVFTYPKDGNQHSRLLLVSVATQPVSNRANMRARSPLPEFVAWNATRRWRRHERLFFAHEVFCPKTKNTNITAR